MILGAAAGRGPSPLRLLAACLALGCVVAGLHLLRPPLVARADLAVYDRLLTATPRRAASDRVALVVVDERSLGEAHDAERSAPCLGFHGVVQQHEASGAEVGVVAVAIGRR